MRVLENTKSVALLLIVFNRPDFLRERLREVESILEKFSVYVAIDGPRSSFSSDVVAQVEIVRMLSSPIYKNIRVINREMNLGCDIHIPKAIEEVLEVCETVIVVEDDVTVHRDAVLQIAKKVFENRQLGLPGPVLGMSSLTRNFLSRTNRWRQVRYFSPWGFGLTREFWRTHWQVHQLANKGQIVEELMVNSTYWKVLSKRQQNIWIERFNRGNYDYQIQQTIFAKNIPVSAPLFRMVSNVGHGDLRAAHTKSKTPAYLKRVIQYKNYKFSNSTFSRFSFLPIVAEFCDSNTWVGHGFIGVRGRTFGVRTILKICYSKVTHLFR
jgi:hypothetical protein